MVIRMCSKLLVLTFWSFSLVRKKRRTASPLVRVCCSFSKVDRKKPTRLAPVMQVIRPGFSCRNCFGLNARWTRALVRRLSIPVKSGDMHDQAASPMSGGCSWVSTLDLDLFFLMS